LKYNKFFLLQFLKMEQSVIINNDEYQLFSGGDFASDFDEILFSNGLQMENEDSDEIFASLFPNDNVSEHSVITDEYFPSEFEDILSAAQNDNQTIFDGVQPIENQSTDQTSDIIDTPSENQGGVIYQMDPSAFAFITGDIFVKQQPKANNRLRYQCDGSRFLPDSRYHPMSINLPNLQSITLQDNQRFGIVVTIISDTYKGKFVHANDIDYRVGDAMKIAYGCVFIPLDNDDIKNGEKKFSRLSIIYKKCDEYTFDLTPFDPLSMFGTTEKYASKNKRNIGNAAKGKQFKEDYNLLSYKLVFQLALKQDNVVYISHITCETNTIDEQKAPTSPGKRSASVSIESISEEDSISDAQISKPLKKIKSLPSPIIGLPVTRASNDLV
jgi:hypothetical protein